MVTSTIINSKIYHKHYFTPQMHQAFTFFRTQTIHAGNWIKKKINANGYNKISDKFKWIAHSETDVQQQAFCCIS